MHLSNPVAARTAVALALLLSLTACDGSSDSGSGSGSTVTIDISERNGSITPDDGHVVDVDKGQPIQVVVTSDVADEIHVHSIPEHEFEVKAGADQEELPVFTIDTPGRFVIESHGLDVTLVTLQVS